MWTIKKFTINALQENCYVVSDQTKACVIIDCGAQFEAECLAIEKYIKDEGLKPAHLLNTHLHFDHVMGNDFMYHVMGLQCEANERDLFLYDDVPGQVETFLGEPLLEFNAPFGVNIDDGDMVDFGTHQFQVLALPGHTPGGLGFYCADEHVLFSGDSLFRCSIGRTDLPQGNHQALIHALTEKVLLLPDETIVYPGHGPATSISDEKKYNPYL